MVGYVFDLQSFYAWFTRTLPDIEFFQGELGESTSLPCVGYDAEFISASSLISGEAVGISEVYRLTIYATDIAAAQIVAKSITSVHNTQSSEYQRVSIQFQDTLPKAINEPFVRWLIDIKVTRR